MPPDTRKRGERCSTEFYTPDVYPEDVSTAEKYLYLREYFLTVKTWVAENSREIRDLNNEINAIGRKMRALERELGPELVEIETPEAS